MKIMKNTIIFLSLLLASCSSVQIQDYKNESPALVLEDYFNGDIEAYGIFQNRSGKVVKRFTVKIKSYWKGPQGTLEEDFVYSDGTKSRRVWTLTKQADGTYVGTASDVIGQASGKVAGNAFHWKYNLALEVDKSVYNVHFDDWMYLMNDKVMLNKSAMSKFGINLGEVTLTFIKR